MNINKELKNAKAELSQVKRKLAALTEKQTKEEAQLYKLQFELESWIDDLTEMQYKKIKAKNRSEEAMNFEGLINDLTSFKK